MDSFTDKTLRNYIYCIILFLFGNLMLLWSVILEFLLYIAKNVTFIDRILFYTKLYSGGYRKIYQDKDRWGRIKSDLSKYEDTPLYKAMEKIEKRYKKD